MAFPVIVSSVDSEESSAVTSHTMTMPVGLLAGELIFAAIGLGANGFEPVATAPAGWTIFRQLDGRNTMLVIMAKVSDGTESGTTPVFTTDIACISVHLNHRINTWFGDLTGVIVSPGDSQNDLFPDSDTVTSVWELADNLFMSICSIHRTSTILSWPTNYTDNQVFVEAGGGGDQTLAAAAGRDLASTSDNASVFEIDIARWWGAVGVVIAPVGAVFPDGLPHTKLSIGIGIELGIGL